MIKAHYNHFKEYYLIFGLSLLMSHSYSLIFKKNLSSMIDILEIHQKTWQTLYWCLSFLEWKQALTECTALLCWEKCHAEMSLGKINMPNSNPGLHGDQLTSGTKKHNSLIFICSPLFCFPSLITQVRKQGLFVGYSLRISNAKVVIAYVVVKEGVGCIPG